jgi:3-deoxy-manno-octulosonate cytidylyltransferase (CMP-KDO synthetase)
MNIALIIPARYGSTRFPGKPLVKIAGETMLSRVVNVGRTICEKHPNITLAVATEDDRIKAHCKEINVECIMTSDNCHTGSDRILEAALTLTPTPDFVIGLQGDAPFTPIHVIDALIKTAINNVAAQVITPVIPLRWAELDALREQKKVTPFSGTTAIINKDNNAIWFSKNIIPAIRKEEDMKQNSEFSPVHQHLGLYGYRLDTLKQFVKLEQGLYEQLEGLEQLRLIENNIPITAVPIEVDLGLAQAGIDSPEDVVRAEKMLKAISK